MKGGTGKTDIDMTTEQKQTERKNRPHPFSERKRAVELYGQGLSSSQVARTMGIDASMVRAWVRRYRTHGLEALRPYYRIGQESRPALRWEEKERQYSPAYEAFSTTLEPVASITRRHGLDYYGFTYHIHRYHPELEEQRSNLVRLVRSQGNASEVRNKVNERKEEGK